MDLQSNYLGTAIPRGDGIVIAGIKSGSLGVDSAQLAAVKVHKLRWGSIEQFVYFGLGERGNLPFVYTRKFIKSLEKEREIHWNR